MFLLSLLLYDAEFRRYHTDCFVQAQVEADLLTLASLYCAFMDVMIYLFRYARDRRT